VHIQVNSSSDNGAVTTGPPKARSGQKIQSVETSKSSSDDASCTRKKRKALSDLLLPCGPLAKDLVLPCGPSASKASRMQPPPTPACMKAQAFVFDLATVAVLMSGHATAGTPTITHSSPLVSPS